MTDLLREYRRLDDSITMRLNRANAQFRDRDRLGTGGKGNVQDQACAYLWKDLVGTYGSLSCLKILTIIGFNRKLETAKGYRRLLRRRCGSVDG